jgi:phosphoribosylaminoimidazolecarboxamide formyltransferase/IMP cyclohydrolase
VRIGAQPIDLVVVNLYPFEQTLARADATHEEIVENIDIGGPSMVRSAAKNHERVVVVCDPEDYPAVLEQVEQTGDVSPQLRAHLAAKAFSHTSSYDGAIAAYLSSGARAERFPPYLGMSLERVASLRYGENPHQQGAWYRDRRAPIGTLARARDTGAGQKELSYNNLVDLDAALDAVREHERPAAVVVKHTNPCGLACADSLADAYKKAREGDPLSAFGGVVGLNRLCDDETAAVIAETFIECVVAPGFDDAALERLRKKKALRLVATGPWPNDRRRLVLKPIDGGFVAQDSDESTADEVAAARVVTQKTPSEAELQSLAFAWRVCKHVKSNAIVLAQGEHVVGVGAGQMSRVDSVRIACEKAGERAYGAVLASDAFFPFPDGIEAAASRGVVAIVQPGGSVKDDEVIAAADRLGITMLFTGIRHFRH